MTVTLTLDACLMDKSGYVFGSPHSCAGAELYRFWETASAAAFPPCAFADGD